MNELYLSTIPAIITSLVTYLLTKRRYLAELRKSAAETESSEIDNIEKATRIWRETSEDIRATLNADIQELRKENQRTREKLNALTRENYSLRQQMTSLEKVLRETRLENEKLTEKIREFNSHFNH